jgi:hypothetical protein
MVGEFEDLIAKARSGDVEALDELESNFSGSALRGKAEEGDKFRQRAEALEPLARKARFSELVTSLDETMQGVGLTADDFADVPVDDLTSDLIRAKAQIKVEQVQATKQEAAKSAGFETVEEYEAALTAIRKQQDDRRGKLEAVGSASASGGGSEVPEEDAFIVGKADYDKARSMGASKDVALGEMVHTLLARQVPKDTE